MFPFFLMGIRFCLLFIALLFTALRYSALHCIALLCFALLLIALHCFALLAVAKHLEHKKCLLSTSNRYLCIFFGRVLQENCILCPVYFNPVSNSSKLDVVWWQLERYVTTPWVYSLSLEGGRGGRGRLPPPGCIP